MPFNTSPPAERRRQRQVKIAHLFSTAECASGRKGAHHTDEDSAVKRREPASLASAKDFGHSCAHARQDSSQEDHSFAENRCPKGAAEAPGRRSGGGKGAARGVALPPRLLR